MALRARNLFRNSLPLLSRSYATEAAAGGSTKTLLILEHKGGVLNAGVVNALSAALSVGGDVVGFIAGDDEGARKIAEAAKKWA